jgi:hypothetical protein
MNQLDQDEPEEDEPGHDAADRRYDYVEGHPSWRRVDQTPDTEAEAGRADEDARRDGDGPVTLGRASHSIRHSRSLERIPRSARAST